MTLTPLAYNETKLLREVMNVCNINDSASGYKIFDYAKEIEVDSIAALKDKDRIVLYMPSDHLMQHPLVSSSTLTVDTLQAASGE